MQESGVVTHLGPTNGCPVVRVPHQSHVSLRIAGSRQPPDSLIMERLKNPNRSCDIAWYLNPCGAGVRSARTGNGE